MPSSLDNFTLRTARDYLDKAGPAYLAAINGINLENLQQYRDELQLLTRLLRNPQNIVSIGVGNGIEPHALRHLTNANILGFDLSSPPLEVASKHSKAFNEPISYIQANGLELPLPHSSVDAVCLSSILHEVYSYLPHGLHSLLSAVNEAVRVIKPGGFLYIKDFAAHENPTRLLEMQFVSEFSEKFYDLWQIHYRKFESWKPEERNFVVSESNMLSYPPRGQSSSVLLQSGLISEFLMHLRNAYNDSGKSNFFLTTDGAISWKEMNEQYHVSARGEILNPHDYQWLIIRSVLRSFRNIKKAALVESTIAYREINAKGLNNHVSIIGNSNENSLQLITELTGKMFLVFEIS